MFLSLLLLSATVDTLPEVVVIPQTEFSTSIAESAAKLPGVVINDYGATGIKSFNFHGLGTANTAVYLDGTPVHEASAGQVDLSMISSMFGSLSLSDESLSAATISVNSGSTPSHIGVGYGTHNKVRAQGALATKYVGAIASYDHTDGYRVNDLSNRYTGYIKAQYKNWSANALIYSVNEGLPGSLDWPSTEGYKATNARVAVKYDSDLLFGALQYTTYNSKYSDIDPMFELGKFTERIGFQQVGIKSKYATIQARFTENYFACDDDNPIHRLRSELIADAKYKGLYATVAYSYVDDDVPVTLDYAYYDGTNHDAFQLWSWNLGYSKSFNNFTVSADYKRSNRTPTLSEIYYYGSQNVDIEKLDLFNISASYAKSGFIANASVFYNYVQDKIVTYLDNDRSDFDNWMYKYSLQNYGYVNSYGYSVQLGYVSDAVRFTSAFTQNKFDKDIIYSPEYTWNNDLILKGEKVTLKIQHQWVSSRLTESGSLPAYNKLDADVSFPIGKFEFGVTANNISNTKYCVYAGYPMQGSSVFTHLSYKF